MNKTYWRAVPEFELTLRPKEINCHRKLKFRGQVFLFHLQKKDWERETDRKKIKRFLNYYIWFCRYVLKKSKSSCSEQPWIHLKDQTFEELPSATPVTFCKSWGKGVNTTPQTLHLSVIILHQLHPAYWITRRNTED